MWEGVPQREHWDGHPVQRGLAFELRKHKGSRELRAACRVQTHHFGLELVLTVQGLLSRSQVCRSADELLETIEHWQRAMIAAGWSPAETASTCGDGQP